MTLFGFTIPRAAIFIAFGAIAGFFVVRAAVRGIKRKVSRTAGSIAGIGALLAAARAASATESEDETTPRSLSRGDSLYLPMIEKDFPDFSLTAAKEAVREYIKQRFGDAEGFRIHRQAIGDYIRSGSEKTIVFQCSYEMREDGKLRQHRALVDYTHKTGDQTEYASLTCPSCGAPVTAGATQCAYCSSRLVMTRGAWEITDCREG